MLLTMLSGCGSNTNTDASPSSQPDSSNNENIDSTNDTENNGEGSEVTQFDPSGYLSFDYSNNIDNDGFWVGVRALDHVELFEYDKIAIPNHVHYISDELVDNEIYYIMAEFPMETIVTTREVVLGDTVNIDYVGSIDGVEFDNGSTMGMGVNVVIGVTNYIDDFLEQLIGHLPGETVFVEVTFPDDYHEPSLQGKDALFVTEINYIYESSEPELTDEFVYNNLNIYYSWTTVDEMRDDIRTTLRRSNMQQYLQDYFSTQVTVISVPETILEYQRNSMLNSYSEYAFYYFGMELEEFVIGFYGMESIDELLEQMEFDIYDNAVFCLVVQAIAEDAGIVVSEQDLTDFFLGYDGMGDYSIYEEQYGLPYLKQFVLSQMVFDYIEENADYQ